MVAMWPLPPGANRVIYCVIFLGTGKKKVKIIKDALQVFLRSKIEMGGVLFHTDDSSIYY